MLAHWQTDHISQLTKVNHFFKDFTLVKSILFYIQKSNWTWTWVELLTTLHSKMTNESPKNLIIRTTWHFQQIEEIYVEAKMKLLLLLSILCWFVGFPSSYKQDNIKTRRPLSTAVSVQHLANYALDSSWKMTRVLLNCNSKNFIIEFYLACIQRCLTFYKCNTYCYCSVEIKQNLMWRLWSVKGNLTSLISNSENCFL